MRGFSVKVGGNPSTVVFTPVASLLAADFCAAASVCADALAAVSSPAKSNICNVKKMF
jgi:hypothetical protein